jgi:hypothetical protein
MWRRGDIRSRIKRLERDGASAASDGELRRLLVMRLVEFIGNPERVRRALEDPGSPLGDTLRSMVEYSRARAAARTAGASLSQQEQAGRNVLALAREARVERSSSAPN